MSSQARKLVEHARTKGAPRFVLYIIADYSTDQTPPFTSFPGFDSIVSKTGFAKSTVSAHIATLVANGDLAIVQRGNFRSNGTVYRIAVEPKEKGPSVEPFPAPKKGPISEGERVQQGSNPVDPSNAQKGPISTAKGSNGANTVRSSKQTVSQSSREGEWKNEWEAMTEDEWLAHLKTEFPNVNVSDAISRGVRKYAVGFGGSGPLPFGRKASWRWLCREKQTVKAPPRPVAGSAPPANGTFITNDPGGWPEFLRGKGVAHQPHRFAPQFLKDEFEAGRKP